MSFKELFDFCREHSVELSFRISPFGNEYTIGMETQFARVDCHFSDEELNQGDDFVRWKLTKAVRELDRWFEGDKND